MVRSQIAARMFRAVLSFSRVLDAWIQGLLETRKVQRPWPGPMVLGIDPCYLTIHVVLRMFKVGALVLASPLISGFWID